MSIGTGLATVGTPAHEAVIAQHTHSAEALRGVNRILYFRLPDGLRVPLLGRPVSCADDPFDPDAGALLKNGREFFGEVLREVGEEVHFHPLNPKATLTVAIHQPRRQARRYARFIGTRTAGLGVYTGATFPYTTGLVT